jgi:hypothetical protein
MRQLPVTRLRRSTMLIAVIALGVLAGLASYFYAPLIATLPHSTRLLT